MHIVTVAEMRELEAQAERQYGLTSPTLMQHAGQSAADIFKAHVAPNLSISGPVVFFLIGPGNNGGDGLIMTDHLAHAGALVSLYRWKERKLIEQGEEIPETETA